MTLLENNKQQQDYLNALRQAINKVNNETLKPGKEAKALNNFVGYTNTTVSTTLCLLEDKVRTEAKYYGCRKRLFQMKLKEK